MTTGPGICGVRGGRERESKRETERNRGTSTAGGSQTFREILAWRPEKVNGSSSLGQRSWKTSWDQQAEAPREQELSARACQDKPDRCSSTLICSVQAAANQQDRLRRPEDPREALLWVPG
jgi:hypothetical protein